MDESAYLEHDGLGLARLVAEGEVTASELLAAARRRAQAVDPDINAVCTWLDDHADERAGQPLTGPEPDAGRLLGRVGGRGRRRDRAGGGGQ